MIGTRVIPCLLLRGRGLVKTIRYKDPTYLGDPINIVRIFNDKEVDELTFLDITASVEGHAPEYDLLRDIATECFIPFGYGGGIGSCEDIRRLLKIGIEKVVLNTAAVENRPLVKQATNEFGSSTIVISVDYRRNIFGKAEVFCRSGKKAAGIDPVSFAKEMEQAGAGEILLNAIDRDGTMQGYDIDIIKKVTSSVSIPVIACGGARTIQDLAGVVKEGGASAAAAGSMFVFQGPLRAVLISYPTQLELKQAFA
jgi:imidazole glycerol-phosphate synthase subunit HisF